MAGKASGSLIGVLGVAESISSIAEGCSASHKSGSVAHGALLKGVEDKRWSLPSTVMGCVDKGDAERPLGS